MKSFVTIALLTAVLSVFEPAAADSAVDSFRFSQLQRDIPMHGVVAARQYKPGENKVNRYRTVVAPGPNKQGKRATLASGGTAVPKVLAVNGGSGGYIAYALSGLGDYTITQNKAQAVVVSVTMGTTDVQNLPIIPQNGQSNPTFPYVGAMVGPANPGFATVPYTPSSNLDSNNYNYVYLTNVAGVPYGPATAGGQSTDNSQPFTESGMFTLLSAASNQLQPAWVNTDGSVVTGQTFARDSAGNVLITANPGSTSSQLTGGVTAFTINVIDP